MRIPLWTLAVVALGCGHLSKVRPTPAGEWELEETLGGPIAYVAAVPVPTPLSTVGLSRGLNERADVSFHAHPTAAAFGVLGLDVGASALAVSERGLWPTLTASARLYGFSDFRTGARGYLEVGGTLSRRLGSRAAAYLGGNCLFQADGPPLWAVAAGGELDAGPVSVQLEWRWYEPDYRTERAVVKWLGVGGQGAMGVLIGWRLRFGADAWEAAVEATGRRP